MIKEFFKDKKKVLENITNTIEQLDEMFIKLAYGELKIDDKHRIVDEEGKIDEKYIKILRDSFKWRTSYPKTYKNLGTLYVAKQMLFHPIKQEKKISYLNSLSSPRSEDYHYV
jgi:hypothetical protein